ncbi:MAG TPA: hypothetical protein VFT72_05205 [Opitutaceae bacterium]|nr:hypothetical protein [Opitutaceae bacterium]
MRRLQGFRDRVGLDEYPVPIRQTPRDCRASRGIVASNQKHGYIVGHGTTELLTTSGWPPMSNSFVEQNRWRNRPDIFL